MKQVFHNIVFGEDTFLIGRVPIESATFNTKLIYASPAAIDKIKNNSSHPVHNWLSQYFTDDNEFLISNVASLEETTLLIFDVQQDFSLSPVAAYSDMPSEEETQLVNSMLNTNGIFLQ